MEISFYFLFFGAVYSYALYPALLWALVRGREFVTWQQSSTDWRALTVIITARNEAGRIEAKLRDVLAQDYAGELEVIVISDAS